MMFEIFYTFITPSESTNIFKVKPDYLLNSCLNVLINLHDILFVLLTQLYIALCFS